MHQTINATRAEKAQEPVPVVLEQITSRASSLGARTASQAVAKMFIERNVRCVSISDQLAMFAAVKLAGKPPFPNLVPESG